METDGLRPLRSRWNMGDACGDGVVCTMILLCYTLGAAVAVMLTVRVGVMDILRDKE